MTMKSIFISLALLAATALNTSALDLNAETCVAMALESDASLATARNNVEKAKLNKGVARTAYLPNFSGSVTSMTRLPDTDAMGMTLSMKGVYMAGINLTQPIYAGGKIVAANKLAGIGIEAAEEQLRLCRMQVIADAETAYWTYVAVLAKIEMVKAYLAQIDTAYSQTKTSHEVGMATRNDLLRIEARRSQVVYQLGQVENGAELCRLSLCHTIGVDPSTDIVTNDTEIPVDIPADLNDYSIDQRPEARLLQADIRAKEQQINITRADFLPTLGLQAGWSAYGGIKTKGMMQNSNGDYVPYSQTTKGNGWSIMASLQVPLWHWGEGIKKVKVAKIEAENARIDREDKLRLMDIEVQQAISNLRTGISLLSAAQTAIDQARLNLDNITESYDLGMASLTDLLDAQSQWQTSWSNMIEARTQLRIYTTDYYRVTGRL